VREQRLNAAPAREDLERADAAGGGVPLAGGGHVRRDLRDHAPERAYSEHVKKLREAGRLGRGEERQRHIALARVRDDRDDSLTGHLLTRGEIERGSHGG